MSDTPAEAGDAEEITPVIGDEGEGDETEADTEVEDPDDE